MPMAKRQKRQTDGKAVIYARYSSNNQREASIEQQVAECKKFAERNNLPVVGVYQDAAISGRTDDRPDFQRMMRDAKKEQFDYIIAWKSNRIGRNGKAGNRLSTASNACMWKRISTTRHPGDLLSGT